MTAPTGELLARFKKSGKSARRQFLTWSIASLCAAALTIQAHFPWSYVITSLFLIITSCREGYRAFSMHEESFEVHSDGFIIVYEGNRGSRNRLQYSYLWSELEEYYLSKQWGRDIYPLILRTGDGKEFGLTSDYDDIKELIDALVRSSLEPLVRRTLSRLEAGEEVKFGNITVTPGGFRIGGEAWPLEDIARIVRITPYAFAVSPRLRKKKKESSLVLSGLGPGVRRIWSNSIPNVVVLAELIARFAPNLQRDEEGQALDSGDKAITELATDSGGMKSSQEHPQ